MDIIILFLIPIVGYFYLRENGGSNMAPSSTQKGKTQRIIMWTMAACIAAVLMSVYMRLYTDNRLSVSMVIVPIAVGILAVAVSNLKNKK